LHQNHLPLESGGWRCAAGQESSQQDQGFHLSDSIQCEQQAIPVQRCTGKSSRSQI
jgi:hypothetical protein